jgi:acetolactate synthase I/II/III large subunit
MNVGWTMAAAFRAEGVSHVFGLMGDGNMDFMVAMRELGAQVYDVRHEGAAVNMADGYQRASGQVGVATVTCGPGVTQLGTALTVANRHRTPLVVVAGDTFTTLKGMTELQDMDQRAFVEASGALFHQLRGPSSVAADVQQAFWLARTRRQPVVLNAPMDIQAAEAVGELRYEPSSSRIIAGPPLHPDPASIEKAADMIAAARRPVLLAGVGAMAAGAREVIESLGERVGAALATTLPAKGYLDGPWSVGVCGTFSTARTEPIMAAADLVVFIGSSGSEETLAGVPPAARRLQLDREPTASLGGRPAEHLVVGDARLGLEAIQALMVEAGFSGPGYRDGAYAEAFALDPLARELEQVDWELPQGQVDPRKVVGQLDRLLPEDCTVVIGAGHFMSFPIMYLSGRRKRRFLYTYDFGCIGQAIPTAFGIAVAEPSRPVVVFEGDGSAMMNIHEFDTIARYQPRLLVLVINDGALGAEYHKLRAKKMDPEWSVIGPADFAGIGAGFGNPAGTIQALGDVEREVEAFMAGSGPRIVDVRSSTTVVSRRTRKAYFESE